MRTRPIESNFQRTSLAIVGTEPDAYDRTPAVATFVISPARLVALASTAMAGASLSRLMDLTSSRVMQTIQKKNAARGTYMPRIPLKARGPFLKKIIAAAGK